MEIVMQQSYVTFHSPGSFVDETTTEPIDSWDTEQAMERARNVDERYGATPFGFQFTTRGRAADEMDSHEMARSPFYYLGGTVLTLAEVKARNDPKDSILIRNMEGNGYDRIIENRNSWLVTKPFTDKDVLLDCEPSLTPVDA